MLSLLGIRHHGPGSAKAVCAALARIRPDLILVEGPPELETILPLAQGDQLIPPVAALGYDTDNLQRASFYPFSVFSPEWQAIQYGFDNLVPVRMADLPLRHQFAFPTDYAPTKESGAATLRHLAQVGGFDDVEPWWEYWFERNITDSADHFEAILTTFRALRPEIDHRAADEGDLFERAREAYMREAIRTAIKDGFQNIVFICGAWHIPALEWHDRTKKADQALIAQLPKIKKVDLTWVPWTYQRLQQNSGYGAGLASAGWYDHRWYYPDDKGMHWLTHCARLLRKKKMDVSTAHVIEAYRLAEALAALRNRSSIGLDELNEATQTVLCFGDATLMRLIERDLVVGNKIGKVAASTPRMPIQADLEVQMKAAKLKFSEDSESYTLDLRKDLDLRRSILLHRTQILRIRWGKKEYVGGKGTFKEQWVLDWQPEMMLEVIEAGVWGNTVELAAEQYVVRKAGESQSLGELSQLVHDILPAELYSTLDFLLEKLNEVATLASDVTELMTAILPLIDVQRYGNVRKTDQSALLDLIESFLIRICVGLPNACYAIDEETSVALADNIRRLHEATALIDNPELVANWYDMLIRLSDETSPVNPRIQGCACRLLSDSKGLAADEIGRRFRLALSPARAPEWAAAWAEGFLKDSSMLLLHDQVLWQIFNQWMTELPEEVFATLLPVLRRTFAAIEPALRRQLGEKAAQRLQKGGAVTAGNKLVDVLDEERASAVIPILKLIFKV